MEKKIIINIVEVLSRKKLLGNKDFVKSFIMNYNEYNKCFKFDLKRTFPYINNQLETLQFNKIFLKFSNFSVIITILLQIC